MNRTHSLIFLCKVAVLTGIGIFAAIAQAGAHAFIDHAEPAVGSTIKQPPAEVCLLFTESVEAGFSSIKVFDAAGKEVDKKDIHLDPKNPRRLSVSLPASLLGAGTYKVVWRAVSVDTHITQGDFTFRVEP